MRRQIGTIGLALFCIALAGTIALTTGNARAESFFDGKTLRIIVAFSPGGGYDAYSRLFARYMKKYIPREQEIIVQNMPGGGGLRAANYLYKVAKRNGVVFAHLSREAYLAQFTEQPGIEYEITKFIPLGSATFENRVVYLHRDLAPYGNLEALREAVSGGEEIYIGVTGLGSSGYTLWKTVEALVPGIAVEFVKGYPGSTEIHLAMRKGEVMGYGQSKSSFMVQAKDLLKSEKVAVLAQIGTPDRQRDPDFPNAPTFWELADSKKDKALVSVAAAASIAGRPFFLPPGVPQGRVQVLREAFMAAAKDPDLLAEAKKIKRPVDPVKGEEIQRLYQDVFDISMQERREITKLFTGK